MFEPVHLEDYQGASISSWYASSRLMDYTMWPWDTWNNLYLVLLSASITLYLVYRAALPKPIPGIPYRSDSARHVLGDIPAILKAAADLDLTHVQWIQQQLQELNSPIIQIFMGPFSRPIIVVADFRETQDVLMRRKEWDRSELLGDLFWGLIPDHHSKHKTNAVWKARRRLLQDLMSPQFLHNVAAPAQYANASTLLSLWKRKAGIAGDRPFSAHKDIYRAALDSVHAFAFGEGFEHNATRPQLELLEGLAPREVQALLRDGAAGGDDEPVQFPDARYHDVVDATLALTESLETVQGTPSMKLAWRLLQLRPRHRRAMGIKDACYLKELKRAAGHMNQQGQDGAGDATRASRVRSAVDHMIQRERQLAQKDGRAPEYFSSVMMVEIFGFVITGHDTTSTTILWGLKFLADNEGPQSQLRSILQASFGAAKAENTRDPSVQEIIHTNIPYLDAVIEEILRCATTIPCIDRQTTVDTHILGHYIPKGTTMFILGSGPSIKSPAFQIGEHLRSQSCQDAKQEGRCRGEWDPEDIGSFQPERWLVRGDGEAEFNREAGPGLPFSLGTRSCYGKRLAYIQLRIFVVLIVWNFELLSCPRRLSGYHSTLDVTNKPKQCFVRLRKIT